MCTIDPRDGSVAAAIDGRSSELSYTDRWGKAQLAVHTVMVGALVDDAEDIAAIVAGVDAAQRSHEPHLSIHQASLRIDYLLSAMTPAQAALVVATTQALASRSR